MKQSRMALATFGALAALVLATVARGQGSGPVDGQTTKGNLHGTFSYGMTRSDSLPKMLTMSSTGGLSIYDEDRDRDKVTLWQDIILRDGSNTLAAAAGDSSGVIDVHAYHTLKLLMKVTPIGASANTTVRLALQFRECMNGNSDSTSVFPEYLYGMFPVGSITASTTNDTTVAGHLLTGSVSLPWSGEYVVTFNMNRSAPANGAAAVVWSYPNGVSIPLDSFFGRPARFNKLQVRIRNLNITGPAVKCNISLLGFAQ